jgi:hypothetical protein
MTVHSLIRPIRVAGLLTVLVVFVAPAHAQGLGGLIKKKVDKATGNNPAQQAAVAPPVFDNVTLEITQERIQKLTAAKQAVRQFAEGPTGPAAYEKQIQPLDNRQVAIYQKQVDAINAWDQKRRDYENCVDSVLGAISQRKQSQFQSQMLSDPASMQKMMQLSQQMMAAQQKGDTAAIRKITEQIDRMKAPTKADSAEAEKHCSYPTPPPLVKEWVGLKRQIDSLNNLKQDAENKQAKIEEPISGMNPRQSAMFCERIKQYVQQLKQKKQHVGFSDDEVKRLANLEQAIRDLEALCP